MVTTATRTVRAAIAVGLASTLGLGLAGANASPYPHTSVVSTSPVMTMPSWPSPRVSRSRSPTRSPRPATRWWSAAGLQTVENGNRTVQYPRSNVFAFNATTGALNTGFAPAVDGDVWGSWSDGTSVYIGGSFKTVNGVRPACPGEAQPRHRRARPELQADHQRCARSLTSRWSNGQLIVSGSITKRSCRSNPITGQGDPVHQPRRHREDPQQRLGAGLPLRHQPRRRAPRRRWATS